MSALPPKSDQIEEISICPLRANKRSIDYRVGGRQQCRVFATGNEGAHRVYSGNPAFRRPSINSVAFDRPVRAINADTVKAGLTSSRRANASRASASRPRCVKADTKPRKANPSDEF